MDYKIYAICAGIVAVAVLSIVLSIMAYQKKKNELIAEENHMRQQIQIMEREGQERIRMAELALSRQQEEFNQRVAIFTKEQRLREDIGKKSDRDVIIEMHVKAMRIFDILSEMNGKLSNVKDYSNQLGYLANSVTESVNDLKGSLSYSVSELQSELQNSLGNMDSTIRSTISENSSDLDQSDIRSAVSDALDYDCYSFKSDLESTVREAVENAVDSKFNDLDWKLSSIESKLDT